MKIRLVVPNCNRGCTPIVAYGPRIAAIAGGFTATQATGGWIDDHGQLIVEPVTVFDCFMPDEDDVLYSSDTGVPQFIELARMIARDLQQHSVYLELDGEVSLVTQ